MEEKAKWVKILQEDIFTGEIEFWYDETFEEIVERALETGYSFDLIPERIYECNAYTEHYNFLDLK